jgi:hypothetical protein
VNIDCTPDDRYTSFVNSYPRTLHLDRLHDLQHDPQIGPLVTGDGTVDHYSFSRMLPAALGWKVQPDGDRLTAHAPDGTAAVAVTPSGRLLTAGISETAALTLLRTVQAVFLAMDEAQEPHRV